MGEFSGGNDNSNYMEVIKTDPMDEQSKQNIADDYDQNNQNEIVVRPYMDGDYARKLCIDEMCQFALYKCMHAKCIFATNSMESWQIHMSLHGQMIDYFYDKGLLVKHVRDSLIRFRECPYCGFEAKADHQVVSRIALCQIYTKEIHTQF